jgi:hypothetical protein
MSWEDVGVVEEGNRRGILVEERSILREDEGVRRGGVIVRRCSGMNLEA